MPDYKAMYFELFRASVKASELLQQAQLRAEQRYITDEPPLQLNKTEIEPEI